MTIIDDLVAANSEHTPDPGQRADARSVEVAIVTCMDARIDIWRALNLKPGQAHVIRNGGGRLSDDAIRSLVISQELLGTRAVMVIHHTDCGMLRFTDAELRERLAEQGRDASAIDFLPFSDLDASVGDDLRSYREHPLLRQDIPIGGFIFDVVTQRLRAVS